MKFISLTSITTGNEMYVNADVIHYMAVVPDKVEKGETPGGTRVFLGGSERAVHVADTIPRILHRLGAEHC